MDKLSKDKALREVLFVPCESKEALQRWIRVYLNLDFPNCTVSEESNSNPMDLIWELYSKERANDVSEFSRVMAYSSRGGLKTLGASVLEILNLFHLGRNVGHMAATKDQSERSQEYVVGFINLPFLQDFKTSDSKKRIEITRYEHKVTKKSITQKEYKALLDSVKGNYKKYHNFLQIVICSFKGGNGLHSEFFCTDELDTIEGELVRGYREAKNIPKARDGKLPITLLTSTRKSSYGMVQKELDAAFRTKLAVRHWNVIDVAERCKPERHRPDLPKQELWINDDTLEIIDEQQYAYLDDVSKKSFNKHAAFAGCKTCPLFSACKTRLATHQTSTSKLLVPLEEIIPKIRDQTLEDVQTQLFCRRPSSQGLVYPRFNRNIHFKTANQIFEMATNTVLTKKLTKAELLDWFLEHDAKFYIGIDFGFTHPFAVTTGVKWGNYCFVVDVIEQANLELDDKIQACRHLLRFNPTVFADPEDPASATTFATKGKFHVKKWDKGAGSVKEGIEIVRSKLQPAATGKPTLFFLEGDPKMDVLASRLEKYHFETDLVGNVSEKPAKVDDDLLDSTRYMIMNAFSKKGGVVLAVGDSIISNTGPNNGTTQTINDPNSLQAQMQQIIGRYVEDGSTTLQTENTDKDEVKKKSRIFWDI